MKYFLVTHMRTYTRTNVHYDSFYLPICKISLHAHTHTLFFTHTYYSLHTLTHRHSHTDTHMDTHAHSHMFHFHIDIFVLRVETPPVISFIPSFPISRFRTVDTRHDIQSQTVDIFSLSFIAITFSSLPLLH